MRNVLSKREWLLLKNRGHHLYRNSLSRIKSIFTRQPPPRDAGLQLPVTLITGNLKNGQSAMMCAYAGFSRIDMAHWSAQIFHEPAFQSAGLQSEHSLTSWLKKTFPACAFVLIETKSAENNCGNLNNSFVLPRFINTAIDISFPMKELCRKSRSGYDRIRRWIRAQNLSCETSHSIEAQNDFYSNMYRPFIQSRHAEGSLILRYEDIFSEAVPSEVFLIKKEDTVVAGGVMHYWDNRPTLGFSGVNEGFKGELRRWTTGPIYYFVTTELQKRGINTLYIGGSPPFLSNGLLFFKMKLLARIDHEKPFQPNALVRFQFLDLNAGMREFLTKNPFVYLKNDAGIAAAVWSFSEDSNGTEEMERHISQVFRLGLDECHVYVRRKDPAPAKWHSRFPGKKIVVHNL